MNVEKNDTGFDVNVGGLWEDTQWRIEINNRILVHSGDSPPPCPHCKELKMETNLIPKWTEWYYICPRVVVATNEGGCSSTGVCLDCILEANEKLKTL